MCHVSVGHVQRALESAGIASVGVYVASFGHIPALMGVARAVVAPHPMGRPLGAPGDTERQLEVVRAALTLLEASEPTVTELSHRYRPSPDNIQTRTRPRRTGRGRWGAG
ncbi:MAG: hypothetical protein ACE5GB_03480 [Acidimicrobiales bacterium]